MKVTSAKLLPYKLRFSKPIHTAAGVFVDREGTILRLESDDGYIGYGDAASWPGFGSSLPTVRQAMENVFVKAQALSERDFRGLKDVSAFLAEWLSLPVEAMHAADLALLDLLAQRVRKSVAELLTAEPREVISVHALVSDAVSAKDMVKQGSRSLKMKMGTQPLAEDVTRVGAVRAAVGRDVDLRLDANGAWSRDEALRAVSALAGFGVAWLEEPVKREGNANHLQELAEVHEAAKVAGVPIAVDESAQTLKDLDAVIEAKAADVLVIKPMFAGGLLAALEMHRKAREVRMSAIVTHTMESAVGRVGAMHLAAALAGHLSACGLANPLAEDVASSPSSSGGWVEVPNMPGLGLHLSAWIAKEAALRPPSNSSGASGGAASGSSSESGKSKR